MCVGAWGDWTRALHMPDNCCTTSLYLQLKKVMESNSFQYFLSSRCSRMFCFATKRTHTCKCTWKSLLSMTHDSTAIWCALCKSHLFLLVRVSFSENDTGFTYLYKSESVSQSWVCLGYDEDWELRQKEFLCCPPPPPILCCASRDRTLESLAV